MANPGADVRSLEGLAQFRAALAEFADNAKAILGMMDMDIQRTGTWLESQARHWQSSKRKAEDELLEATQILRRKKLIRIGGRPVDTLFEEKEVRRAKAWLEYVEEKLAKTKHWLLTLPDALLDYEGPARQSSTMVEQQVPRMNAILQNKIDALEKYMREGSP
jgi:hypothetical protein